MVQEELKDIYEDSVIYVRYPGVPWGTLGHTVVCKEQLSRILSFSLEPSRD